jgi:ubiquinone biosynthesis protein
MTPLKFTRGVQSLHRLQYIARVLTQHGFGHIVHRLELGRLVPIWLRRTSDSKSVEAAPPATIGRRLRRVANDLGPIYVKFGQILAGRPDVLPPEILAELRSLQDDVDPFDVAVARTIIGEELGKPLDEAFASFDDAPVASGSIGQVHRATLPDGREVVVKVRRPNIESSVRADLQILRWLAEALERWVPESRVYRPTVLIDEFERTLAAELDFLHEAAITARFSETFREDPHIDVPEVIWSHSTVKVLTLQLVSGENLDQALERDGHRLNRKELAKHLADAYLRQFFELGTFHADPHPGNILIMPPARIGLVDFGQTGVIGDTTAGHLLMLLIGAVSRDVELVTVALVEMGASGSGTDRRQLSRDVQSLLDKYYGQPLQRLQVGTIFYELAAIVRQHDLLIPRDVVLMLKSLATVWGVALRLDPDLDLVALMRPRLSALVRDRLGPRRLARAGGVTLWHLFNFLKTAPQQLREVLRQVSSGQWQLNVRHENLDSLAKEMDRSGNRLAFSIVIAAVVIASSMIVTSDSTMVVLGIRLQVFGFIGYIIAGILGIGLLVAILRSGRLS